MFLFFGTDRRKQSFTTVTHPKRLQTIIMIRNSSSQSTDNIMEYQQERIEFSFRNMAINSPSPVSYSAFHRSAEEADGHAQEEDTTFDVEAQNGFQCYREGRPTESLFHFARALRQRDESPDLLPVKAEILIAIANLHSSRNDTIKSIHALQYSLEMLMAYYGPKSPPVAMVLQELADDYAILDQPETAAQCLCEALAIALASQSATVTSIWKALGQQLMTLGLTEDAQTCFDEARQLSQTSES